MKNTFSIALIFLCLSTSAQTLKLGDHAPLLNPYEWIKGKPVKEFEKGKVYVIEFGATWCKPCIAAIPGLSKLQEKYNGQVEVISIFVKEVNREPLTTPNPKYVTKVKSFVAKQGADMSYTVAVDDALKTIEKAWVEAFGGGGIPQTFVVDKEGRIAGHFRGIDETSLEALLVSILDGTYNLETQLKKNTGIALSSTFNSYKPLFVNGNGGEGDDFVFRSILTKAKDNVRGRPPDVVDGHGWAHVSESIQIKLREVMGSVQAVNATIARLYYLAYADTLPNEPDIRHPVSREYVDYKDPYWNWKKSYNNYWHEPILEVTDTTPFLPSNQWNYALKIPDSLGTAAKLQQYMRQDLDRYFGYDVTLETREMPCWFLKAYPWYEEKLRPTRKPGRKSESRLILQEGDTIRLRINGDMRDLIIQLHSINISRNNNRFPFIDQTGIKDGVDHIVSPSWRDVVVSFDWEGYLDLLNNLGLYIEKGTKPMKVVVIRDPKSRNEL